MSDFFIPPVNTIGSGAVKQVGDKLKSLGAKKPLLVTDKGITAIGVTDQVVGYIKAAGLDVVVYDETVPNPTDKNVVDGLAVFQKSGTDSIVSLGGGSSHDCAKGIGILVGNGGNIRDYAGIDQLSKPMPPFVAINTTAGTASEMTRFAVITNTEIHVKMVMADWRVTPNFSINDPDLMIGMPPALTAATGMDALTHAVEAYVSIAANPITDACALMSIDLIAKYLRKAVARGTDIEAREQMAYAQFLAGMAFNSVGLGYVHAMAHQPGSFLNLPHGVCNAILLPHVCTFNLNAAIERFATIAEHLGVKTCCLSARDAAIAGIEAIKTLSADVAIPANLTVLGVKESDLQIMAENAQKDVCALTNPRTAKLEEIIGIYKNAL
ncbi:MAG: iron-containing alcohol dehydrogenase [Candidatus Adiutrix sp.]|jgi:alcohol dehydrogenase|nr:iron-containing alcohol dehydrogenase [Candidatus Adiutrix sp.]